MGNIIICLCVKVFFVGVIVFRVLFIFEKEVSRRCIDCNF